MRPRSVSLVGGVLLMTGMSIGGELRRDLGRTGPDHDEVIRAVSISDCSFERSPDGYRQGLRRHMEELSAVTDRVGRRIAAALESGAGQEPKASIRSVPSRGYIDDFIFGKMHQDGIPHAPPAGDAEFFRRVSLDLTGRIPGPAAVRAFLKDDNPRKRSNLIRDLLASPEFVDKWTMYFGDLLRNTSFDSNIARYDEGRNALHSTIRQFVAEGVPYDVFVKRLVTGSGSTWTDGNAAWVLGSWTPMGPIQDTYDTLAVRSATQFLGLGNMDCLFCHSGVGHLEKLNVWATGVKRSEAWEMAAFFSRTRMSRSARQPNNNFYWTIADGPSGNYNLNTTSGNRTPRQPIGNGNSVAPRYIFSSAQAPGSNYREMFANNLIRDRQFARATVNYLWRQLMGLGIVEPADQFDLSRLDPANLPAGWTAQPSHPELLEALTDDFIRTGFNIRYMIALMADSSAYQLSSRFDGDWQIQYTSYFARKLTRRLWAEEIHDAVTKATGIPGSFSVGGYDPPLLIEWAMQLPEPGNNRRGAGGFLDIFLRGDRDQNPRSDDATILQALHMMNNTFVLGRVRASNANTTVARLLANNALSDSQVVEELFLTTLSRFPTAREKSAALAALKANRVRGAENLQWVLMNKIDFLYNY